MIVLGIDSSTAQLGIGLADDHDVLIDIVEDASREHAARIIGIIEQALTEADKSKTDLGGIGVAIGPGSFTGLRIGLSVAKGLITALKIPLVGISTYEIIANRVADVYPKFYLAGRSRRGEYYLCHLEDSELSFDLCDEKHLDDYVGSLPVGLIGGDDKDRAVFATHNITLIDPGLMAISAGQLALTAVRRIADGQIDDPGTLEPLYVAPSQAERKFGHL